MLNPKLNGMTLIEVVIGIGLFSILVFTAMRLSNHGHRFFRMIGDRGTVEDLKFKIRNTIDCGATFPGAASTCSNKSFENDVYIDVYDIEGNKLAEDTTGTEVGSGFVARAKCADMQHNWGIFFEIKDPNASQPPSPMNPYLNWRPEFRNIPIACPKYIECNVNNLTIPAVYMGPAMSGNKWCSGSTQVNFPSDAIDFNLEVNRLTADDSRGKIMLNSVEIWSCPISENNATNAHHHFNSIDLSSQLVAGSNIMKGEAYDGSSGNYCHSSLRISGTYKATVCNITSSNLCSLYNSRACY